jgi:hypothetical protein
MKTIAMLGFGAALAFAADQDPAKKPADPKPASSKTVTAKSSPVRPTYQTSTPMQPKRNVRQPTVTPAPAKLTADQKAAAALPTVPQGAVEAGANLYRFTDAQGKHWMYRKTPFGVSKWEEKPGEEESRAEAPAANGITGTDMGDSVQFQRATPFGPQKWTRKKSEMNEEEKAAFALGAKPPDAAKPPEKQ